MMSSSDLTITVRDPLWDTIRLDHVAVQVMDSREFQRLRHIKQLGLAHLVYPGATHTRFDHALGVYHLTQRALSLLGEQHEMASLEGPDPCLVMLAGLLHDIGHYPFSHALEELDQTRLAGDHEELVGRFLANPELSHVLDAVAPEGEARIEALVRGRSTSPLQGLISGSLDLDKIEYLKRDAHYCGVPYGEVDVDRLLHSLRLLPDPETGRLEVGVEAKGVAALESLLFAKYQMFRNVYWHHAVRGATVLFKRIVADSLDNGLLEAGEIVGQTDERILYLLERKAESRRACDASVRIAGWLEALRARVLPKRACEVVAAELGHGSSGEWLAVDSAFKRGVEERIAMELRLPPGSVFLDYPEKAAMFALDLLVQRRSGEVFRLGPRGRAGLIGLPEVALQLYQSARVLRLFTLGERVSVAPHAVARLASLPVDELAARLEKDQALLERSAASAG